ncbi:hypothetical protein DSECCO2_491220 [anaerobic digester metagenome]
MQFNSHEVCFNQPYSHRPVDTATTDYPWNHGITGYLTSPVSAHHPQVVCVNSSPGVGVSVLVTRISTSEHKNIMEGQFLPTL